MIKKLNMKKFHKMLFLSVLLVVLMGGGSMVYVYAAYTTTVPLLTTDNFAVLAGSAVTNVPTSVITGDMGLSPSGGVNYDAGVTAAQVVGTIYAVDAAGPAGSVNNPSLLTTAKNDLITAYDDAAGRTPFTTVAAGLLTGTLTPGVYRLSAQASNLTTTVTLDAGGNPNAVFIFQSSSTLITSGASSVILAGGAQACNVFWQVGSSVTLGANSIFKGTILALTSATLGAGANVEGRVLARNGSVSLDSNTITKPTCAASAPTGPSANFNVIKHVVNLNGGTSVATNFTVHVKDIQRSGDVTSAPDVAGSPASGKEAPGTLYTLPQGTYAVREDINSKYSVSYSGDCDALGNINLYYGDNKTCIITNTSIAAPVPPLINILKVPSPLALPLGPGPVTYGYTVTNIGIVAMNNVTIVDNKCAPVNFISGDTNSDSILQTNETWTYRCTIPVNQTTTNIVTATGHANGLTAVDTAEAIVVVGVPLIPPLIHIVKVPDPLTLPASGGNVVYRYTVTNPGIVALSDVGVTDDKCTGLPARVVGHPGDLNKNDLLEPNEKWSFTCSSKLTKTTTNTATVKGSANGFTVTDIAQATVVVAAPKLPNTGIGPNDKNIPWNIIIPTGIMASLFLLYSIRRKQII